MIAHESPGSAGRDPIAIVGVGCRLPGGVADPGKLWEALLEGRDCIVDIPGSRWDPDRFLDRTGRSPGRSYVQKGGMLTEDPKAFDAEFFGILPREAAILDPQQRLLLQCSWEAFEDSGDPPEGHAGARTGVFMGGFMMDSQMIHGDPINREGITTHSATANTLTMLSNRLSYVFDLHGPSISLDAACASSLIAVHQACQSIWAGESDAALAGGVNVMLAPETHITMAKGRFLSPTGRCQAFSDRADGYVRAEGAVVLLLKPLAAARRAGNPLYATILGTAVNHDGRTNGITVPNVDAQVAVMRSAYDQAGVAPSQVCYVEAHGTGTPVGDPIEATAIGTVLGGGRDGEPCRVGSIKTNLGHLEAAAGAAGVLKAALCVKHGLVPPHLHLGTVNPAIDLTALNLAIPTESQPLPRLNGRRVAGVNSFGYGGANAHVVLAEPPAESAPTGTVDEVSAAAPEPLLVLSARSPAALQQLAERHARALGQPGVELPAHCRSAAVHRSHHRLRASFEAGDRSSLITDLRAFGEDGAGSPEPALSEPKLMFVFTGMGPQWWAMGRELLLREPVFRAVVEQCDAVFREITGRSILSELLAEESLSRMTATEVAQPANVVLQIALARLLASWGVRPDAALGHSVGEVAAAYVAGALSLHDALSVAHHRSRLQGRLAGRGGMLAVDLPADDAARQIERFGTRICIAAVNSDHAVTLAGDRDALEQLAEQLKATGVFNRFLHVEVPYHSAAMTEIREELLDSLAALQPASPALPVYSTVSGARMADDRHDAVYWWHNVRDTVSFADALTAAIGDGHSVFLELGPHPVLAGSIRDVLGRAGVRGVTIASMTRGAPELRSMRAALQALYAAGAGIDWATFFGPGAYTPLPKYPWQQAVLWAESDRSSRRRVQHDRHPMIADIVAGAPPRFVADLSFAALPFLEDHSVAGLVLFPAAGYVELALAARCALTGNAACSIEDLEFKAAVPIEAQDPTRLTAMIAPDSSVLTVHREREDSSPVLCARATLFSAGRAPSPVDQKMWAALRQRLSQEVAPNALYVGLARRGLRYGPSFQAVRALRRTDGQVFARLALPDELEPRGYHMHPVLFDAALHSLFASVDEGPRQDLIPVSINRIQFFGGSSQVAYSHGRIVSAEAGEIRGDVTLFSEDGAVIAEVTGFVCRLLPRADQRERLQRHLYTRTWIPLDAQPSAPTSWLVFNSDDAALMPSELAGRADPVWLVDLRWATAPIDTATPVPDGAAAAEQLLATVRALPPGKPARYFVVTCGAEVLPADSCAPAIDRAILAGVARTIMSERPDLTMTLVDVDTIGADMADLLTVLGTVGGEQEIALRNGQLFCSRVDRGRPDLLQEPQSQFVPAASGSAYELRTGNNGTADKGFVACERAVLGADDVEIEIHFAAVTAQGASGRISRIGDAVTGFGVGDRVHALLPDALRSHAVLPQKNAIALPDDVDLEASSALSPYLSAYHGLVNIAQLQKGETVLIHDAFDGVGLAAVEIAKWIGADVIATADSEKNRDYVRALGVAQVSASHQVRFYDDVMTWTQRRGVDVVLNFSSGELLAKSVACLAPSGRFIYAGKTSFERDAPLSLRSFTRNLLFASVDVERLAADRPDYVSQLYVEVLRLMGEHKLGSVPVTVVLASQVGEPGQLAPRSDHGGNVCVCLRDPALKLPVPPPQRIRADATYLVSGGLGGFGLQTATWLVERGARHLALVSRRGPSASEARESLRRLAALGVTVRPFAADVTDRQQTAAVLDEIEATMPPLRGIVHSAAVFDDHPVAELDRDSLDRVLGPKAQGAWHLHSLTDKLDFFVLYSSISALIGNPGQANYVAANAALDALAALRRSRGLPASVIQWGALGETGLVARDANVARHLGQLGMTPLSTDDALAALGAVIDRDIHSVAVVDADWSRLASMIPPTAGRRRLQRLATGQRSEGAAPALQLLDGLTDKDALELVEALLTKIVAAELEVLEHTVEPAQSLRDVGVDSLMGLEIATAIEKSLGVNISAVELASGWSITRLAQMIVKRHDDAGVA